MLLNNGVSKWGVQGGLSATPDSVKFAINRELDVKNQDMFIYCTGELIGKQWFNIKDGSLNVHSVFRADRAGYFNHVYNENDYEDDFIYLQYLFIIKIIRCELQHVHLLHCGL